MLFALRVYQDSMEVSIPSFDQIEAGTFMFAAAASRGDVLIKNVIPKHLEAFTAKLLKLVLR